MILQSDNPIRMVRELKGAPLSILMVLSIVHQRVTQEYLERATGYTDKPVSQALAYMQEIGLADHTNAGWQLIKANVMQLPLPLMMEDQVEEEEIASSDQTKERPPRNDNILSRNISDSLITTTLNNNNLLDSVVVISNNAVNRNNSDFEANLEEFKQQGIGINKRTEALARMSHVNPGYIRFHLKRLKKNDTRGLAIMRMEQGEAPPGLVIDLTDAEKRAKYGEWEQ
jgi:hypothetical protein